MLFSIIIPTYNPSKTLDRALVSIAKNQCLDEIEVIIADDCSTEDFSPILDKYKDALNLKIIHNDVNRGDPYWGREYGRQVATGDWLTFMDQDDEWNTNTFDQIKHFIEEQGKNDYFKNLIVTDITMTYDQDNLDLQYPKKGSYPVSGKERLLLTHGKFIERKFIEEYNIFYDDLVHCHDINFMAKIMAILIGENLPYVFSDFNTYNWHIYYNSVSRQDPVKYLYDAFYNACDCTFYPLINYYNSMKNKKYGFKTTKDDNFFIGQCGEEIYLKYWEIQMFIFYKKQLGIKKIPKGYHKKVYQMVKDFKKTFELKKNKDVVKVLTEFAAPLRSPTQNCMYPFMDNETFYQYLRKLPFKSLF